MRTGNRLCEILLWMSLWQCAQCADLPTASSHSDLWGPHHAIETGTCEAYTVNYVTRTAPALCPTGAQPGGSAIETANSRSGDEQDETQSTTAGTRTDEEASIADAAGPPFMSFEDWKEEMLKRTGQDPQELRSRRANEALHSGDRRVLDDSGNIWGDEEEIALDFDDYVPSQDTHGNRGNGEPASRIEEQARDSAIAYDDGKRFLHRSKDAGKTCKERFSYSSFDAGATILKAGSGTKNPKALLVEYKDSYMLLECGRENKFVIIELSDDILLDTVVIANFEFFSSMIRHFRISVSDRYPVKVDKWKELGTFEARNSRDIQAFLVENPQIWARYVRIEFLTHYGNEYYCPVSLIRIHGTRMLDSWKEADGNLGEDAVEDDDREARQCEEATAEESDVGGTEPPTTHESQTASYDPDPSDSAMTSMDLFAIFAATCPALPAQLALTEDGHRVQNAIKTGSDSIALPKSFSNHSESALPSSNITLSDQPGVTPVPSARVSSAHHATDQAQNQVDASLHAEKPPSDQKSSTDNLASKQTQASQASKQPQSGSLGQRSRGTPTSNTASASPTVQEGFFNSITKRLAQVESNLTLSMKYIEDQSRHVQEAMQRMEQKQSQRISSSLDLLNNTVFSELRSMRDQYEELLRSTVQALESQRERNEQDAVALSARLNLLADEVVFQKRMAIAQAVLLLSCLFLVIFSRGNPLPYLTHPQGVAEVTALASSRVHTNAASRLATSSSNAAISQHLPSARLMTPESMNGTLDESDDPSFETDCARSESQYHAAHTRYYRPSHPPTPQAQVDEEFKYQDIVSEGTKSRLPASDQHNARKPLPALPEHPLSP